MYLTECSSYFYYIYLKLCSYDVEHIASFMKVLQAVGRIAWVWQKWKDCVTEL